MRRFCSVCGKPTEDLHEGLCTQCFVKEHDFISLPKVLETTICKRCFRQCIKRGWHDNGDELESAVKNAAINEVQHALRSRLENEGFKIRVEDIKVMSKGRFDVLCKVVVEGVVKGVSIRDEKKCTVKVNSQLCPDCSRISGGYYEAILQIRGAGLLSEEEVEKLSDAVTSLMESYSGKKRAFISNFKRVKGGADFYIGSAKIARKISHVLKRKYGGELLESAKLVGKTRDGRNEYRITIVFRLPKFKVNDIIEANNRIIQILNLGKNKLTGFNLKTRSKTSFPLAKIKDARIIAAENEIRKGVVSDVTPDKIQIIDMADYKTFYLSWAKKGLKAGAEVKFIRNDEIHLLMLRDEARPHLPPA
ncbi:MAG: NMD3-related protein [Candidatus Hydrothermarchaeales archaeon]